MALSLDEMSPISERGNPLLWWHHRLHYRRCSPRRLKSGCLKIVYCCKTRGCPGTVVTTESLPFSGDFLEEGKKRLIDWLNRYFTP